MKIISRINFASVAVLVLALCLTALVLSHRQMTQWVEEQRGLLEAAARKLQEEHRAVPPKIARPFEPDKPGIFVITPTYTRRTQLVDLTRMSHSLFLASISHNLLWIVVEDSETETSLVSHVLAKSGVTTVHLHVKEHRDNNLQFKANTQRNLGIKYIQQLSPPPSMESKAYFADDDNAYDIRLFDEIAQVRQVGVWPVAYSGARRVEYPMIDEGNGQVKGFFSYAPPSRAKFPVDMASFAVCIKYFFRDPPVMFEEKAPTSSGEARFLAATGITWAELEPRSVNEVLVWHVKTAIRVEDKYDVATKQFRYV